MVVKYEPDTVAWATYECTGTTRQFSCDALTSQPASKHILLPFQPSQCFVDKTYTNGDIKVERHIKYGSAVNPYFGRGNKRDDLDLDLYQAKGDKRKKRPAVVFLHSGAFLEFNNKSKFKKDDVKGVRVCMTLAKRGYVVASINYRVVPLKTDLQKVLFSAVPPRIAAEDARAAVRFMRKQAKDWRLDSDRMLIAGTSAGAFASNFFAYKPDQTEGHSGNPGFSSAVNGVLSVSGSLNDRAMCLKIGKGPKYNPSFCLINGPDFTEELQPGGVPVAIIGGDKDWMVPFKDTVKMKEQADKVGIRNIFLHVPAGRHVPHLEITNKSLPFMDQWLTFVSGSLNLAEAQCPQKRKKGRKQK
jgi:acetyl esterase/lipase